MSTKLSTSRKVELDALRALSCLMVILIHVTYQGWHTISSRSVSWQLLSLLNGACRGAVPAFVMISGIFFLKKEMPLKTLYTKYILRMFVVYAIWELAYAVDTVNLSALTTLDGWKDVVIEASNSKYHLWYLPNAIGSYIALPMIWPLVRYKDGKYLKYVMIVYLSYLALTDVLQCLPKNEIFSPPVRRFAPSFTSFQCLMLIGYYLYEVQTTSRSNKFWIPMLVAMILLSAIVRGCFAYRDGEQSSLWLGTFTFPNVSIGICLLQIFKNLRSSAVMTKLSGLWTEISACSLGIYLLHVFVMEHLTDWLQMDIHFAPIYLSVPILTILIFLICWGVVALLRRIPKVGKWIV